MTRKDYQLIAKALADTPWWAGDDNESSACTTMQLVVEHMAWALSGDNPRFDSKRFFEAVGIGTKKQ